MNSIYASEKLKQEIWPDFIAHFKSGSTIVSYRADLDELMNLLHKDFLKLTKNDVEQYYQYLQEKIIEKKLQPITVAKKMKEAHSFADYIVENKEKYKIKKSYKDEFEPYLKLVAKQQRFVNFVPVEDVDRLFDAAKNDEMVYCILALMHRAGLSSTEIIQLKMDDLGIYEDGVYAFISGRKEYCYIPEDVFEIMKGYMKKREQKEYFFYNKRGNQLNTMFISRMMKKYTQLAGIPAYSAESIRNTCAVTMFAYGATNKQVASQLGITQVQIQRYKNLSYRDNLMKEANSLVKIKITPP